MSAEADLKTILKAGIIANELELERALVLDNQLRLMMKEQPQLAESRKALRALIHAYEETNWSKDSVVDEAKMEESDLAEFIAKQERLFVEHRKAAIKAKLTELKLTQQDLGILLGHGKSYMSELMNGVSAFHQRDLIIIHRLLHIPLEELISTTLSHRDILRLKRSISNLNKPQLKLPQ